jgi:hypothetical protein
LRGSAELDPAVESALLGRLERLLGCGIDDGGLEGEAALLARPHRPPLGRLWRAGPQLVTTRRIAARPGFAEAAVRSRERGWPVVVRASGGTTVIHRPGVLNVSLALASDGIGHAYRMLGAILIEALAPLLDDLDLGPVPGSYCDGAHNLRWRGRKLAGLAAMVRGRVTLVHASLVVGGDLAADVAAIGAFERDVGLDTALRPDVLASVAGAVRAPTLPTDRPLTTGDSDMLGRRCFGLCSGLREAHVG